ncbi:MAG: 50S ribosomal protein L4 [Flavobacteriaceae bacterium]|nr:50S ribosomal protein L4 [Flavobacteriaceae bacterium]
MNKKERRLALYSVLSLKIKNNQIVVIKDIKLSEIKTKAMDTIFKALPYNKNILFALNERNEVLEKSANNLPYVKNIQVNYLNIKDLLKYNTLVLLKDSLESLNSLTK